LRSLYHAIFISNVETARTKQVTDGLADAFGRRGTRVESISGSSRQRFRSAFAVARYDVYDHETLRALSRGVAKTDPSPLLPESDEDRGVGTDTRSLHRRLRRRRAAAVLKAVAVVKRGSSVVHVVQ
jgi:hypothetical protein